MYAGLRASGDDAEAKRVASAVAALLGLATSALVLAGVLLTPLLIAVIAPGFEGEKRAETIRLVRILFPGAGLLALSAWCLGVLNSHRRFFSLYSAPVIWNLAIILSRRIRSGGRAIPVGGDSGMGRRGGQLSSARGAVPNSAAASR